MSDEALPQVLLDAFDGEAAALDWALALPPSMRREIAKWVLEPKREAAQLRRAAQMAERLMSTMEAERELPGFIRLALGRMAGAASGWARMPRGHRRQWLLAVFGAVSLEARERQVEKLVEASRTRAET